MKLTVFSDVIGVALRADLRRVNAGARSGAVATLRDGDVAVCLYQRRRTARTGRRRDAEKRSGMTLMQRFGLQKTSAAAAAVPDGGTEGGRAGAATATTTHDEQQHDSDHRGKHQEDQNTDEVPATYAVKQSTYLPTTDGVNIPASINVTTSSAF